MIVGDKCRSCNKKVTFFSTEEKLCNHCQKIAQYLLTPPNAHMQKLGIPPRVIMQIAKHFPDKTKLDLDCECSFFTGEAGLGKTVKAAALLFYIHQESIINAKQKPKRCKFITCPELLLEIRSTFGKPLIDHGNGEYHTAEEEVIAYYQTVDVLVLDDIGVEKVTDWTLNVLYLIISHRYEHFKKTFFTSNFSLNDLMTQFGDARLVSRINGWCNIVEFTGQDKRQKVEKLIGGRSII